MGQALLEHCYWSLC